MSEATGTRTEPAMQRDEIVVESSLRSAPGVRDLGDALRLLLDEVPRPRHQALVLTVLIGAEVGATAGLAVLAKVIIDDAIAGRGVGWPLVAIAALLAVAGTVLMRSRRVKQEDLVLASRERAVERVARVINGAPMTDLTSVPMAALRELLMTDVDFAYRFFVESIGQTTVIVLWALTTFGLLVWLSPPILAVLLALAVVATIVFVYGLRKHLELTGPRFERLAETSQRAREVVEVERVMLSRQLGIDDLFVRGFVTAHRGFLRVFLAQQRLAAGLRASILGVNGLAFVGAVVVGGALISQGSLGAGALIAMLFAINQLIASVNQLSEHIHRAAETARVGRRLAAYWTASDDDHVRVDDPRVDERITRVVAEDLTFAYADDVAVDGIDVDLRMGQLACLTGATGVGKTTLALLLTGILPPDAGRVVLNDDATWRPRDLAPGRMLYVGTRPILLEGSVRDNLLLDEDEAATADLSWFTDATGLPTDEPIVGPNGTGVSSGQSQLIGLARAIVRDPEVVVFDEATSALDMPSEARVQRALIDWCRDRVTLVISHRSCPWTELADHPLTLERP